MNKRTRPHVSCNLRRLPCATYEMQVQSCPTVSFKNNISSEYWIVRLIYVSAMETNQTNNKFTHCRMFKDCYWYTPISKLQLLIFRKQIPTALVVPGHECLDVYIKSYVFISYYDNIKNNWVIYVFSIQFELRYCIFLKMILNVRHYLFYLIVPFTL